MRKPIFIFITSLTVVIGMVVYFVFAGPKIDLKEGLLGTGVVLVVGFALFLGVKQVQSLRKSQPAQDELSKKIVKRAASTSYYISLYSWLVLMYFSDKTKLEAHSLIGLGILLMAIEFAGAWVYHNFFGKINE